MNKVFCILLGMLFLSALVFGGIASPRVSAHVANAANSHISAMNQHQDAGSKLYNSGYKDGYSDGRYACRHNKNKQGVRGHGNYKPRYNAQDYTTGYALGYSKGATSC